VSSNPTPERREPRAMLALIALQSELPVPASIGFNNGILSMSFPTITDGLPWLAFFGRRQETYVYQGHRYLKDRELNEWHGWHVQLHASEPAAPDTELDEATAGRLAQLARSPA